MAPEDDWLARHGKDSSRKEQPKTGTVAGEPSGEKLGINRGEAQNLTPSVLREIFCIRGCFAALV